jgi:hypothetical protein
MMNRRERTRLVKRPHEPSVVGLVRMNSLIPPFTGVNWEVRVVLQQALGRIGEAGRRFAQCLFETRL